MTAVEYLLDQMFNHGGLKKEQGVMYMSPELVEKAKEMEKQQIIDAYRDGRSDQQSARNGEFYSRMAEQYYNEIFNNED